MEDNRRPDGFGRAGGDYAGRRTGSKLAEAHRQDTRCDPQFHDRLVWPGRDHADKAAATAWGKLTGNKVNVINSSNLTLQLTEGFAGGSPPDVFYGETPLFESMAKQGQLLDSGNLVAPPSSFYPSLVNAYTYNHTFYCVPKDSSTLAIEINTADWKAAGLTNANLPTTWAKLAYDAKVLTKGKTDRAGRLRLPRPAGRVLRRGRRVVHERLPHRFHFRLAAERAGADLHRRPGQGWLPQVPGTGRRRLGRPGSRRRARRP